MGLNSTLISCDDNKQDKKLVLGEDFASPDNSTGIEYLSLCHHPPQWLRDEDKVHTALRARVRIQLFGHKHIHMIEQIENTIRIGAGAVHPDRNEPSWDPRYNWISIYIDRNECNRHMVVEVYARRWGETERKFLSDHTEDGEASIRRLKLQDYQPVQVDMVTVSGGAINSDMNIPKNDEHHFDKNKQTNIKSAKRELMFCFLRLSYLVKMRIATQLALLIEEDKSISSDILFGMIWQRAIDKDILSELWELTSQESTELSNDNPFK